MEQTISINYPEALAFSLKMEKSEFASEMKVISIVKLYELGKISSAYGAELLGLGRIDFLDLLYQYKVSFFHKGLEDELENDMMNA